MSEIQNIISLIIRYIDWLISAIFEMKPQVLFVLALYGLGMVFNHIKKFPGWLIPLIIIPLGGIGFRWFIPENTIVWNVQNQEVITATAGVIIGMSIVMFYDYIGKYLEAKAIGWVKAMFKVKTPARTMPDNADK